MSYYPEDPRFRGKTQPGQFPMQGQPAFPPPPYPQQYQPAQPIPQPTYIQPSPQPTKPKKAEPQTQKPPAVSSLPEGIFKREAENPRDAEKFCKGFEVGAAKLMEVAGLDASKYDVVCIGEQEHLPLEKTTVKAGVRKKPR